MQTAPAESVEAPKQETDKKNAKSRLIQDDVPFVSQKDFRPTPFQLSAYEFVGERFDTENFHPIEVPVLAGSAGEMDPMFDDFGSDVPRDATVLYHGGVVSERQQVKNKKVIRTEHEGDEPEVPVISEEQLAAKYEEGRQAGYLEGEEAAKAIIAERYDEISKQVTAVTSSIDAETKAFYQRVEKNTIQFALAIAKKILITTAEAKPEYIIEVIRTGLQSLGAGKPLRIRVSNDDYEFLKVIGLPAELSAEELGVEYIADEEVKAGCIIETDFGDVDLQLETMWAQVRDSLFEACS